MSIDSFRPVRGIGLAASVLIGLVAALTVADAVSSQYSAGVVREYADGTATMEDLRAADAVSLMISLPGLAVFLTAGVVFLVWLHRARYNSERISYADPHRHKRGWTIGSWFVPIVNLWFPQQVVQDVYRGSDRSQADRPLVARNTSGLVNAWWAAVLVMWTGDRLLAGLLVRDGSMDTIALLSWVSAVITIVAAVLAVRVIKQINDLQHLNAPNAAPAPAA